MGGSISKKESESDRLGRKQDAPSPAQQTFPGRLRSPELGPPTPGSETNSISISSQAGFPGPPGLNAIPTAIGGLEVVHHAATAGQAQQSVVPTVFRWEHGGNQVFITGTFNNWSRKVPMHRSGNDFTFIQSLPKGRHAYKFVVDDEWRFAPDQPTVADTAGNINNYIDLTNFKADDDEPISSLRRDSLPNIPWGRTLPDEDEYSKEPPLLPPHLRTIILNSASPDAADPLALPAPAHVCLNHLYCTAIKDGLMVQATSHRYRRKAVTTVFYSATPPSSQSPGGGLMPLPGLLAQQGGSAGGTPMFPRSGGYTTPPGLAMVQAGGGGGGIPPALLHLQGAAVAGSGSSASGSATLSSPAQGGGGGGTFMGLDGASRAPAHALSSVPPPPLPMPSAGGSQGAMGAGSSTGHISGGRPPGYPPLSGDAGHGHGRLGGTGSTGSSGSGSTIGAGHGNHAVPPGGRRASVDAGAYASKVAAAYSTSGGGAGQGGGNYAGY